MPFILSEQISTISYLGSSRYSRTLSFQMTCSNWFLLHLLFSCNYARYLKFYLGIILWDFIYFIYLHVSCVCASWYQNYKSFLSWKCQLNGASFDCHLQWKQIFCWQHLLMFRVLCDTVNLPSFFLWNLEILPRSEWRMWIYFEKFLKLLLLFF